MMTTEIKKQENSLWYYETYLIDSDGEQNDELYLTNYDLNTYDDDCNKEIISDEKFDTTKYQYSISSGYDSDN